MPQNAYLFLGLFILSACAPSAQSINSPSIQAHQKNVTEGVKIIKKLSSSRLYNNRQHLNEQLNKLESISKDAMYAEEISYYTSLSTGELSTLNLKYNSKDISYQQLDSTFSAVEDDIVLKKRSLS